MHLPPAYPFPALLGQEDMRLALTLLGVDPALGGVLLTGEKGTAKSTAARGLARVLPPVTMVEGGPVGCNPAGELCPFCLKRERPLPSRTVPTPFVELPLGATEDRLLGSLDLKAAVTGGRLELKPGLLARANQGVLYIDEVNLLPPHLAHLVLDAAAGGICRVEREGLSVSHPARFALVASMNPEEGILGPQLTDRFGLCVEVAGEPSPEIRREILLRRLAFEAGPQGFMARWAGAEKDLTGRLERARRNLLQVRLTPPALALAAHLAQAAGSRGQRGELALCRAARALAALSGREEALPEDVRRLAHMALMHRADPERNGEEPLARLLDSLPPNLPEEETERRVQVVEEREGAQETGSKAGQGQTDLRLFTPGAVTPVATRLPAGESGSQKQAGRRAAREVNGARGRYVRASAQRLGRGLAFDATFRAAAPHQLERRTAGGPLLVVRDPDIREKVRVSKRGRLLVFCVDASGSMNAAHRMRTTKEAVLGLLTEAYQKRDRVGLVAFGGTSARLLLPPTGSVEVARRMLAELPSGGKTPLAAGLVTLARVLETEMARDPRLTPLAVILTDGRPNVPLAASLGQNVDPGVAGDKGGGWGDGWGDGGYADREVLNLAKEMSRDFRPRYVVVDTDTGNVQEINLCRPLADYLGAPCVSLGRLTADRVLDLVRKHW